MRAVLQVVTNADVKIDGQIAGEIQKGLLVLLGVGKGDTAEQIKKLADKIIKLRIFDDEDGKKNLSIRDVGGSMLIVSQFTLYWNCKKGNRPSFDNAMPPQIANELYLDFVYYMKEQGIKVQTGQFGADMKVSLTNDGPVTVVLDTDML
ncbi:MAG: D-tyrosyl-tRNA(Tyr) deacylase [Clostridia bacterium]|nr:D-tyrosyl-tRNA(Tyr) deacylase [Clostridia bacterium]